MAEKEAIKASSIVNIMWFASDNFIHARSASGYILIGRMISASSDPAKRFSSPYSVATQAWAPHDLQGTAT